MPPLVHGFDWPDRVVVGTIGQPGSRSFYLQARTGRRIVSVGLEKQQSAALAEKIEEILDELMSQEGNPASVPATTPAELVDNDPLDPVEEEFRTGTLSLGWDPSTAQVVIQAFPVVEIEIDEDQDELELDLTDIEPDEMLLVRIPVGSARAFAKRTLEVVGAGRPLCPRCGMPIDPEGHVCDPLPGLE
ncbi:hypothetical protein ASF06_06955 [Agreia sp. Leaf244]|uniref:DUF3090 domain-containing protein n=1 Tax=unclassified Agreia TaxID=2641148 RepID=UPI0006FCF38F|nr:MULTISPECIES: DUF3090 domain-containing protein [unclassified Agreia]KQO09973.1 hypothetical protein ASF06_06955 [Agreia sp. Leaf244]KQP57575.1 hypothetical protein ASF51_07145 [Agreia sp. Leaf283]